eukprot:m51a1_g4782 putative e3 ubiquitin-protein ligase trim23 (713) ;mRNA; r:54683-56933
MEDRNGSSSGAAAAPAPALSYQGISLETCPVCLDEFDGDDDSPLAPLLLSCGHSACRQCLARLASAEAPDAAARAAHGPAPGARDEERSIPESDDLGSLDDLLEDDDEVLMPMYPGVPVPVRAAVPSVVQRAEWDDETASSTSSELHAGASTIKCPICRANTALSARGDISSLRRNYSLAALLGVLRSSGLDAARRRPPRCDECCSSVATVFCVQCAAQLCPACDANAHRLRIARGHRRVPADQRAQAEELRCPEHGERLHLFCIDDKELCCLLCRDYGKHKHHQTKLRLEAAEEAFAGVAKDSDRLKESLERLSEHLESAQELVEAQTVSKAVLSTAITECFREIHKAAHTREEELLAQVQSLLDPQIRRLEGQRDAVSVAVADMRAALGAGCRIQQIKSKEVHGTPEIQALLTVWERIRAVLGEADSIPVLDKGTSFHFEAGEEISIISNAIDKIGSISGSGPAGNQPADGQEEEEETAFEEEDEPEEDNNVSECDGSAVVVAPPQGVAAPEETTSTHGALAGSGTGKDTPQTCLPPLCALRVGPNYTVLGNSKNRAVKTGKDGSWNATVLSECALPTNTVVSWVVRLVSLAKGRMCNIMVGVAPADVNQTRISNYGCGWYLFCYDRTLYSGAPHNRTGSDYAAASDLGPLGAGSEIRVLVDTAAGEIRFFVDNSPLSAQPAYCDVPLEKPLAPAVILCNTDDCVEIDQG